MTISNISVKKDKYGEWTVAHSCLGNSAKTSWTNRPGLEVRQTAGTRYKGQHIFDFTPQTGDCFDRDSRGPWVRLTLLPVND